MGWEPFPVSTGLCYPNAERNYTLDYSVWHCAGDLLNICFLWSISKLTPLKTIPLVHSNLCQVMPVTTYTYAYSGAQELTAKTGQSQQHFHSSPLNQHPMVLAEKERLSSYFVNVLHFKLLLKWLQILQI